MPTPLSFLTTITVSSINQRSRFFVLLQQKAEHQFSSILDSDSQALPGLLRRLPTKTRSNNSLVKKSATADQLEIAAQDLKDKLDYAALLVTRGSQGMMLLEDGVPAIHIKAVGAASPVDVTGAGDTVIATFALALSCDSSFSDAARLANYAGGLVVMKRGTASVTASELENSIINSEV